MQDMSWIHNPALQNIHPKKMSVITELVQKTEGKPIAQSLPFLMQANKDLQREGLSFTEEESTLIMDILTRDLSAEEKERIARMTSLIKQRMRNG